ncbi:hypothetical protein CR513_36245, partial [Mucuna pruriens]
MQYYDPPLRCFTFKDFQLTPTLEEYERLLGLPLAKSPPYLPKGHYPSRALVAKLLKTSESEVLKRKRNRNGLEGLPKASIEERLHQQQREDALLAKRDKGDNPVIGAINYNLELEPRQAGYPMVLPPSEEAVTSFVIHGIGMQNEECLKKI